MNAVCTGAVVRPAGIVSGAYDGTGVVIQHLRHKQVEGGKSHDRHQHGREHKEEKAIASAHGITSRKYKVLYYTAAHRMLSNCLCNNAQEVIIGKKP